MRQKIKSQGLTLMELMVAMATGLIVIFSIGLVLVDSHKGWNKTYEKVNGDLIADGYTTKRVFESIVRKSSVEAKKPTLGAGNIELYYYESPASPRPDSYAKFYLGNGNLLADYGSLDAATENPLAASRTNVLAHNVISADFSYTGTNVQMILVLGDNVNNYTVACSAVRHSE